jgi:hypothetical protein
MMESSRSIDFFTAGGTFRFDSSSYVKRPAEDDLFELALTGEFYYVLTAYHLDFSDDFLAWKTAAHQRLRDFQRGNLSEKDGWTSLVKVTQIGMERWEVIKLITQESTPFERRWWRSDDSVVGDSEGCVDVPETFPTCAVSMQLVGMEETGLGDTRRVSVREHQ